MVYSCGGISVGVGWRVGVDVSVGVEVMVGVLDGVGPLVGEATEPVARSAIKTTTAPMMMKRARNPSAAGRESVSVGMRLPWMILTDFVSAAGVISVPHTRQRVAVSLNRVPQVGQIFVFEVSGLIATALYHAYP
jgi:hypothetical protein